MPKPILGFKRSEGTKWLSNFWSCRIAYGGIIYQSVEAAFQAQKHLCTERKMKIAAMGPYDAMIEGRTGEPREGWDSEAVGMMAILLRQKFNRHNSNESIELLGKLLATGDCRIAETNDWGDLYWGENSKGEGHNILGRLLMILREERRLEALPRLASTKAPHHNAS